MPAGRTSESLTTSGQEVEFNPGKSFTWYDRQWWSGAPVFGNWTCYELHLPGDVKESMWVWDNATPYQHVRAGTFSYQSGEERVVSFEWVPSSDVMD